MAAFLFINLYSIIIAKSLCDINLVINEINLNDPKKPEVSEFVELRAISTDTPKPGLIPLDDYQIMGVGISTKDKKSKLQIDLIIDLKECKTNEYGYFGV